MKDYYDEAVGSNPTSYNKQDDEWRAMKEMMLRTGSIDITFDKSMIPIGATLNDGATLSSRGKGR